MTDSNGPRLLDYGLPERRKWWVMRWPIAALPVSVGLILLALLFVKPIGRPRWQAPRVKCMSNLRQIGQAILLYSNDNGGRYPDTFGELLLTQDITSAVFVCPSSNDAPAAAPTTQAQAADLDKGSGCVSYIYFGKGMYVQTVPPDAVIAYEPLSNHGGDGTNVLFGDGHVEFLDKKQAATILTQVSAGVSPVRYPQTQPSTGPRVTGR